MLKRKKGEGYIDTVVTILISLIIVYTTTALFTHFISYQKMNAAAKEIVEYAANRGETSSSDINNHCVYFIEKAGLDKSKITVSFSDSDIITGSSNGAVQYGDEVAVSLSCNYGIKIFGSSNKNYTMTAKRSALSEKYWK